MSTDMTLDFVIATIPWADLWQTISFQGGHNTNVVLRGTIVLGIACGIVGSFLLLRKRALVADALSHAALPGVCLGFLLAVWLGVDGRSLSVLLPAAAVFGLLGVATVHVLSHVPRIKEDAAIGAVLSVFFAGGVVLLSAIQRMALPNKAGLNHFIFGQAATMNAADVNLIAILAVIGVGVALIAFKELRLLCFDAPFARSLGWSTLALDGLLLALITMLTVIGLHAVGAILMVALLIIPAAAARFWTERLGVMAALAAVVGALACLAGSAASAVMPRVPTGPAIVIACGGLFLVSLTAAPKRGVVAAVVRRATLRRTMRRQHLLRAMFEQGEIVGDENAVITFDGLVHRRSWSPSLLRRLIRRGMARGEIQPINGGFALTPRGRDAAARIVRTHRIWEHFLTTQADIAPSHVDRAADDIEHVLSEDLIADLEGELREIGALEPGEFVPRSPHALVESD